MYITSPGTVNRLYLLSLRQRSKILVACKPRMSNLDLEFRQISRGNCKLWRDVKGEHFRSYAKFFLLEGWKPTKKKDPSICSGCCLTTRRNFSNSLGFDGTGKRSDCGTAHFS